MTETTGMKVPNFTASATGDKVFTLSDHTGKYVVLYFYPKDNTPGCTNESIEFNELSPKFRKKNCVIFGISRDSIKSHESFKSKYDFQFELISDPDESVCKMFDVIKMKNMYGKQVRGIERSTFLIGPKGTVVQEWRKVKVPGHAQEVLDSI